MFKYLLIVLLLPYTCLAQQKTLDSILKKADTKNGFFELQRELELYSKSKPTASILEISGATIPIPVLDFDQIGVGISDKPFGCRECIGTIAVYPNRLKESVPYLAAGPNATVGSVLNGLKRLNDITEALMTIAFMTDSKTLYIHTRNYYFAVNNVSSFSPNNLTISVTSRTKLQYYNIATIAELKSHIPNVEDLKVYVVATDFPPPAAEELK